MESSKPLANSPTPIMGYQPQSEVLKIARTEKKLRIGIPCEISNHENRVPLIPDGVDVLTRQGHQVLLQSGAGKSAHFSDHEYNEAGAEIVPDAATVFQSDIVVKVAPCTQQEMEWISNKQSLFSFLNTPSICADYFKKLISKKVVAFSYEKIQDEVGTLPIVRAMSEIAGNTSILVAAEYMSHPKYGRGKMLGGFSGIAPSEVVILGAGTVGEFAARAALGMGALVKVFDNNLYKLRRLQNNLNQRIFTSTAHHRSLSAALLTADVLIGAVYAKNDRTPCMVTEEMVRNMKQGAILIDLSIDQGGCIETSQATDHKNPVYRMHEVTHYCVPNILSRVPRTASVAINNILTNTLLQIGEEGGVEPALRNHYGLRQGVYIYNGISTEKFLSERFQLPFQDINLLMAAFR